MSFDVDEYEKMIASLKKETASLGPEVWVQAMDKCAVYIATAGEWVAHAQQDYDEAYAIATEAVMDGENKSMLTPAIISKLAAGKCSTEKPVLEKSKQLHKTLVHRLDAFRTMISQAKAERGRL